MYDVVRSVACPMSHTQYCTMSKMQASTISSPFALRYPVDVRSRENKNNIRQCTYMHFVKHASDSERAKDWQKDTVSNS